MRLRSSIVSVALIFAIALVLFTFASMTPMVPVACADGTGNEPQPKADTTLDDSTITKSSAPDVDDPSPLNWLMDVVTSAF
ncbi:MAG: hypothetical protein KKG33_00745 [candidate division Zixibacteria bacterium]|nr:hypothetical protein [candidate division Zixibacteria bacterium]